MALIEPFSGPAAALGRYAQNSIKLQADEINARGGLLGSRVEVVAADDELNPAKAAELGRQQLLERDVGLVVGPGSAGGFLALRPALQQAQAPNCVTAATDDALTGASFSFRPGPADRAQLAALLDYVRRSRGDVKRLGLLDDGDEVGQSYDRQLGDQAGRAGLGYVGRASSAPGDDHRPALQQLLNQGAQAVIVTGQAPSAARTAQALQQLGARVPLLGFDGLAGYDFAAEGGDVATGAVFAGTIRSYLTDVPDSRWPAGYRTFVSRITHQYGYASNAAEMQGSPAVADCLTQWARAVEAAGTFRGPNVVRAWEALDIPPTDAALGVRERFSPTDHSGVQQDQVFVYTWARQGAKLRAKQLAGPSA